MASSCAKTKSRRGRTRFELLQDREGSRDNKLATNKGSMKAITLRFSQRTQGLLKIRWPGRFEPQLPPCSRMGELQLVRMQKLAGGCVARQFLQARRLPLAVNVVAGNRKTKMLEVHADLMRSACM